MKSTNRTVGAIILAAGIGSRMKSSTTKQKMSILGVSVLKRCVIPFFNSEYIGQIVVVCRSDEIDFAKAELSDFVGKPISFAVGGEKRQESARLGFNAMNENLGFALIHDCARCLITEKNIADVCEAAFEHGAATASCAVTDTVKCVKDGFLISTLDRNSLATVQTPQIFERELYERAVGASSNIEATDDNMLVEALGYPIKLVDTGKFNIKLTTSEDIALAEFILNRREKGGAYLG